MITRFLSAVFIAAFLLLLSLTGDNANAKVDTQSHDCLSKTCRCVFSVEEIQCIP